MSTVGLTSPLVRWWPPPAWVVVPPGYEEEQKLIQGRERKQLPPSSLLFCVSACPGM